MMHRKMALFVLSVTGLFLGLSLVGLTRAHAGRSPQEIMRVTAVQLKPTEANANSKCPITVTFSGRITTDGPGTVRYTFTRNDGATGPEFTLDFKSAETKEVATTWTLGDASALPHYSGWQAIKIISPNQLESDHEAGAFTISCQRVFQVDNPPPTFGTPTPNVVVPNQTRVERLNPSPSPERQDTASSQSAAPASAPAPPSGVFRVTLNGFSVGNETADDILERDGKGDEIYVVGEVWVLDSNGNFTDRRTMRSRIIGDATDHPERQSGGSRQPGIFGGDTGGFRTGDSMPPREPWRRTHEPFTDRIPMFLWEGTLTQGQNVAVILPSLWEWDSDSPGEIESSWEDSLRGWTLRSKPQLLEYLTLGPQEYLRTHRPIKLNLGSLQLMGGNSPILGSLPWDSDMPLEGPVLTLSYDSAVQALQTSPSDKGLGIFEFRYSANEPMHGSYTVYLQVERVR